MIHDHEWSGLSMQQELLHCQVVYEDRVTDAGAGRLYYLKLGHKLIQIGTSQHFADLLQFALVRNARSFECESHPPLKQEEAFLSQQEKQEG